MVHKEGRKRVAWGFPGHRNRVIDYICIKKTKHFPHRRNPGLWTLCV